MRHMHVTPTNRQTVYRVVVAQWTDVGVGIGVATAASRAKLSEEATRSVLDVLTDVGLLTRTSTDPDHPMWAPAAATLVTVGRGSPVPRVGSTVLR